MFTRALVLHKKMVPLTAKQSGTSLCTAAFSSLQNKTVLTTWLTGIALTSSCLASKMYRCLQMWHCTSRVTFYRRLMLPSMPLRWTVFSMLWDAVTCASSTKTVALKEETELSRMVTRLLLLPTLLLASSVLLSRKDLTRFSGILTRPPELRFSKPSNSLLLVESELPIKSVSRTTWKTVVLVEWIT